MGFEKSINSFLFLLGYLKVGKSLGLPFDIPNIINRKLSYIKHISYIGIRITEQGR
jgi:hypothetical protein